MIGSKSASPTEDWSGWRSRWQVCVSVWPEVSFVLVCLSVSSGGPRELDPFRARPFVPILFILSICMYQGRSSTPQPQLCRKVNNLNIFVSLFDQDKILPYGSHDLNIRFSSSVLAPLLWCTPTLRLIDEQTLRVSTIGVFEGEVQGFSLAFRLGIIYIF